MHSIETKEPGKIDTNYRQQLDFFNQAGFLRSPCQIPMGAAKIAAILDTNDKQNLTMFRLMRI
jgi:hypothetical protein